VNFGERMFVLLELNKSNEQFIWKLQGKGHARTNNMRASEIVFGLLSLATPLVASSFKPPEHRFIDAKLKVLRAFEGDPDKSERLFLQMQVGAGVGWAERASLGAGLPTRLKFRMVSGRDGGWAKLTAATAALTKSSDMSAGGHPN
jgi:hypothetical protein